MPAGDGITFSYRDYVFDPRPLFTVNKEVNKTASNVALGTKYSMTLNGQILPTGINPIDDSKGGLKRVFASGEALREAFSHDFGLLYLGCAGDDPLISGHPKVISIDFQNASDNYTRRIDYTINLELPSMLKGSKAYYDAAGYLNCDDAPAAGSDLTEHGLTSISDDITVEFMDEQVGGSINLDGFPGIASVFSIQRTVSAVGDSLHCIDGETTADMLTPAQRAAAYVTGVLLGGGGLGPAGTGLRNLMCVNGLTTFNNFRSVAINEYEGSVNVSQSMIANSSGTPATEEFEVSIDKSIDTPFTSVSVNGTIQGLTSISYDDGVEGLCPPTGQPKFNNALNHFATVSGLLYARASSVYGSVEKSRANPTGELHYEPLSQSIGYNIVGGTVTYNNTYDDRPYNCHADALTETISFSFNHPNDIFASLTILGKPQGPLFQQIGTSGATTRELSIDAIIPVQGDCASIAFNHGPTEYDQMVANYEGSLYTEYDQVFVNSFGTTWEPKIGHFTLNKSWTVGFCR